jgi:predicted DNA-binding transcriptional regulator YafY
MLLLLQARGQVTASELAERLEVSPRTVYRDAEALSSAGVPLYAERGRGGGIRLLPGYRTDVTGLTRDEAKALFVLTTGTEQADLGSDVAVVRREGVELADLWDELRRRVDDKPLPLAVTVRVRRTVLDMSAGSTRRT